VLVITIEHLMRLPRRLGSALVRHGPVLNLHRKLEVRLLKAWLDLGCGRIPYALKLPWDLVVAVDMSEENISAADRLTEYVGLDRTFSCVAGCATAIPLHDAAVEGVVCNCVLEHVEDDGLALEEIHRVLQPNGFLFLSVDCDERELALGWLEGLPAWVKRLGAHSWVTSADILREGLFGHLDDRYEVVRRYSGQQLHRALDGAGFEVLKSSYYLVGLGAAIHEAGHMFRFMDVEEGLSRIVYWLASLFAHPLVIQGEDGKGKGHGLACFAVKKAAV
jgi:SAM-dependent methyltransferase